MKYTLLTTVVAMLFALTSRGQLTTADNGLTTTSANVQLGGTLNKNTTIDLGSTFKFDFLKGSSNYLSILNDGKIGIGIATPTELLHLNGNMLINNKITGDVNHSYLQLSNAVGSKLAWGTSESSIIVAQSILFRTNNAEKMRLTQGGWFGIGTNNPSQVLHVEGGTYGQFFTNYNGTLTDGQSPLRLKWGGGSGRYIEFFYNGNTNLRGRIATAGDSKPMNFFDNIGVTFNGSPYVSFGQNTEGMRDGAHVQIVGTTTANAISIGREPSSIVYDFAVKQSGNVVVGANTDNGKKFQVSGDASVSGNTTTGGFIMTSGAAAGKVLTVDAAGVGTWQTPTGGSSGWSFNGNTVGSLKTLGTIDNFDLSLITNNTEKSRLFANGNFAIGSSTDNGKKLQVAGDASVSGRVSTADFTMSSGAQTGYILTSTNGSGVASWAPAPSTGWSFNGNTVGVKKTLGTIDNFDLSLITNNTERIRIDAGGNVSIGSNKVHSEKLAVDGVIKAKKVRVTVATGEWADYVFADDYKLPSLGEIEAFIKKNKHLPEIPSAAQVEKNGLDLGENQALLLKKVEELTLYIIEQNKKIEAQQQLLIDQQKKLEQLEKKIEKTDK